MKIIPILTEKSIAEAKKGHYTFWVPVDLNKYQIKELVNKSFGVHVIKVSTQSRKGRTYQTLAKKKVTVSARKKALVVLKDKEKIELFEGDKK